MFRNFFLKESNMLWAIGINAIVIFLLHFPQFSTHPDDGIAFHQLSFLDWIDYFFIILFTIEAIVKINTYGVKGYFKSNWNRFDFLIVLVSAPTLLSPFVMMGSGVSFLKLLRLARMIRLVRLMSFIPRMKFIMQGLGRALKASIFVILALFFLNFILALFTCHFYGKIAPEYFGDPLISSYYIFQMFTVEGWNEIPANIAEAIIHKNETEGLFSKSVDVYIGLTRFYFILVVLAGGIFGMSLANAVFVDEMTSDNNNEVEVKIDNLQKQIEELKVLIEKKI